MSLEKIDKTKLTTQTRFKEKALDRFEKTFDGVYGLLFIDNKGKSYIHKNKVGSKQFIESRIEEINNYVEYCNTHSLPCTIRKEIKSETPILNACGIKNKIESLPNCIGMLAYPIF